MAENKNNNAKMGVFALTMLIMSAMIGGGVFNIPQNMAADAGTGANIIAWVITALGVWFLAQMFRILSAARPDATAGLFTYGQLGFGSFTGFFSAWGYWIANIFSNVAYAVLLMGALDYFFPGHFTGGNNIPSVIGGSIIIWIMYFIVLSGVKNVSSLNIIGTIAKLVPLILFIFIMAFLFRVPIFIHDFWGLEEFAKADSVSPALSVFDQVKNSMLVTLWMYLGIEGAVVVSDKARSQKDVGRATILGFLITTVIYVLLSLLPNGSFSVHELSTMPAPSTAEILLKRIGVIGEYIMNIGVILSILSSWLIWTIVLAELPHIAAQKNAFPKGFAKVNKHGSASFSLLISTIIMQLFMIFVHFADNAWTLMLSITSVMFIPCYIICIMYLLKIAFDKKENYPQIFASKTNARATGVLASIYGIYLIYAAGVSYLLMACIVYSIGIPFYFRARKQDPNNTSRKTFGSKGEESFAVILLILGIIGIVYFALNYKKLLG